MAWSWLGRNMTEKLMTKVPGEEVCGGMGKYVMIFNSCPKLTNK